MSQLPSLQTVIDLDERNHIIELKFQLSGLSTDFIA